MVGVVDSSSIRRTILPFLVVLMLTGHLLAFFTVAVWSFTYVSTKYLLGDFTPPEILLVRLVIAVILLKILAPVHIAVHRRREVLFAGAGLTGICLYFILENYALSFTTASNVGVILALAPLFTAVAVWMFLKDRSIIGICFIIGFLCALSGVALLSFRGSDVAINPLGDFLTVCACCVWAVYSVIIRKISLLGLNVLAVTRRSMQWGILFILPFLAVSDINTQDFSRYVNITYLANLFFLGIFASALCFASWNYAVRCIGAVATSVYIYAGPLITVVFASIVLNEQLNLWGIAGCILTLGGLILSSLPSLIRRKR